MAELEDGRGARLDVCAGAFVGGADGSSVLGLRWNDNQTTTARIAKTMMIMGVLMAGEDCWSMRT